MKKRILITGANGFMGQHLIHFLQDKNVDIIGTGKGASRLPQDFTFQYISCDLCKESEVEEMIIKANADVIVHTAALSKPDECENDKERCIQINVKATEFLLKHSQMQNSKTHFIYISTDFIFGENGPHTEDENPNPLNFYGESKLMAELVVKNYNLNYSIVRPVFMYGKIWGGLRPSFLHWVKKNLEEGKKIKVVSDQLRTPTFIDDLSWGVYQIILNESFGVYHIAGKNIISPFEMAITVADVLRLDKTLIENVTSETFPEPVKRAKKSGLLIQKAIKELNYNPLSFEEAVLKTFSD